MLSTLENEDLLTRLQSQGYQSVADKSERLVLKLNLGLGYENCQ